MSPAPEPVAAPAPAPAPTRGPFRRLLRVVVPVGGFGLVFYLLHRIGWQETGDAFRRIGLRAALLLLCLSVAELLLDGEALYRAMLGRVGRAWTLVANGAGTVANMAVPLEGGEFLKGALLRQRSSDSRVLSGLVVWNYAWKLSKPLLVLLAFLGSQALGHVMGRDLRGWVAAGVAFSFVPYFALRLLIRLGPAERGMRLLARVPVLRRPAARWAEGAARLDHEVRHFWVSHPRPYVAVLALQFLARAAGLLSLATFAGALGMPTDPGSIGFLYATMAASDYLTQVVPLRVGPAEGATFVIFTALNLDPASGVVMVLVTRLRAFVTQLPFGLVAWWGPRRSPGPPS